MQVTISRLSSSSYSRLDGMAYDMRLMMSRYQRDGMVAAPGDIDQLTTLLGRRCGHTMILRLKRRSSGRG
jgi:hypothetical protein